MPYRCYVERNFADQNLVIIDLADEICREYMGQGYTLTLRQLYYQFVARGHVPNSQQSYNRIGSIINDARLAGKIDWDAIEDRTRNLEEQSTWGSPKEILEATAEQFRFGWWEDQTYRVEVWVEKEALVGVIERAAYKYRVPYFACRGYASQSELWRAGNRFKAYDRAGQRVVVLHLGDHDPSGIDMTRDNEDRLRLFSGEGVDLTIDRLALNHDQVRRYKPPPNPAKMTDSRAEKYIEEFGKSSWELDALDPKVIDAMISTAIERLIDAKPWAAVKAREAAARKKIARMAKDWKD